MSHHFPASVSHLYYFSAVCSVVDCLIMRWTRGSQYPFSSSKNFALAVSLVSLCLTSSFDGSLKLSVSILVVPSFLLSSQSNALAIYLAAQVAASCGDFRVDLRHHTIRSYSLLAALQTSTPFKTHLIKKQKI